MQNIQRTLSFIGPECPPSSSSERASNAIVRRWLLRLASFALTVVTLGTLGVPAQAQGFFEKGSTPSFTASQVERGKVDYASRCLMCHDANLDGGEFGPALKGASFKQHWGGQSPGTLFSYLMSRMPPSDPGVLDGQTYADLEAYLLQANGVEAGAAELTAAELAGSGVQGAPAPEPGNILPANHDAVFDTTTARRKSLLDNIAPVTDGILRHPPDGDWLTWRRTYNSLGYSPLRQIDRTNVHSLREAWAWVLQVGPNEITPLVHDGIIFIKSANTIQALDGRMGDLLWQYARPLPASLHDGSSAIVKNLAISGDMLYAPTADGHIVALNVKTGALVWDQQVLGPREIAHHLQLDGGPIVAKGKVIMGASGCNTYPGGCFILGLDAQTGNEVWRFHTIARPGQPGGDSWNGAPVDQRFGASVWTSGSYDPDLNLVYFGIGQTYDTGTLLEPQPQKGESNDGLYTDSTVALDPDTGKLVWYYQHMNRDVWDLDWAFEQSLITLPIDGKATNLVVTGGKIMVFDAVDRADGKYEFSEDLGLQNLVIAIDPKTGKKIINPALEPEANVTKHFCPHSGGGRNWPATSYDPETKILYVPLYESCQDFTWVPRDSTDTAAGGSDMRFVLHARPNSDGKIGRLEAINLETKKVVWTYRQRAAMSSSTLTTAGGLVFAGSRDRCFRAFDAATGEVLWQSTLGAALSSTPVSYSVGGQQYIAVVAGNGGPMAWPQLTPEIANPLGGTTLWVFKLPDARDSAQP
jgi:alcohol dehydrogenase (cytochrome c)